MELISAEIKQSEDFKNVFSVYVLWIGVLD